VLRSDQPRITPDHTAAFALISSPNTTVSGIQSGKEVSRASMSTSDTNFNNLTPIFQGFFHRKTDLSTNRDLIISSLIGKNYLLWGLVWKQLVKCRYSLKMQKNFSSSSKSAQASDFSQKNVSWDTFPEILRRLHQEGIYLHPHQLAEFMLRHGLPVDLDYVPKHLRSQARFINANYEGDMARAEVVPEQPYLFPFE
jgi:hypothetical protein